MPRSSKHKSSKHSSKEAKEYSDSERDSGLKDRKGKEESSGGVRVSKDSSSSEKRKIDSKEGKDLYGGSGNGDYSEDYSSSKRRKERIDDKASDRWNGGEDDHRGGGGDGSKKSSKASGDSKSKRRDESMGMYEEAEVVKKSNSSSAKGDGRHRDRDSSRKEGRDGGPERDRDKEKDRERKSKEGRSERLVGGDEHRSAGKQVVENSDLNAQCESGSPEPDNQLERRMRKRRDNSIDVDKHHDDMGDINNRRLSSRDDTGQDGRQKDEKRKEDRYKEKHREDVDRDNKHRDDRQRDERSTKDYLSSRSEDKHEKDEKDTSEMQNKRSKLHDGDRKGDNDRDLDRHRDLNPVRDRDRDRHHDREREREREHGHGRDHDYDHDWDWDGDRNHDRERDRERNRDRNRDRERERDRDRDGDRDRDRDYDRDHDHDFDRDYGSSHHDDRTSRYKDSSRAKRRSPDDRDDFSDIPSRGTKARYSDVEKKSISGDRTESDANKGRSHSRQTHLDTVGSSDKRRNSPSSSPYVGLDESRYLNPEVLRYRDSTAEQRSRVVPSKDASGFSGVLERGSKYRSMDKPPKMDDALLGDLSNEKSSSSKASPLGLMERSPSSSSIDRRYMHRPGTRRSLDIEETGRRASVDNRDFCISDDRVSRDLPFEKPLVDESSPVDTSFYNRNSHANSSLIPPHPAFRAGVNSPSFIGSMEDDSRVNSSSRYRRNGDPNIGRGHNNAWRGFPNWTSPLPNGFIPFQHGPPGTFQGIMPQFPGPLFGVRPSMEINHTGMPCHIPDADRFSGHLRPLGWQNMMDGTGPSHLHGWDGSNGVFRDEPHLFAPSEWDQNRHSMNSWGRESSVDTWKGQNGDPKRDLLSPSHRDDYPMQASVDDDVGVQAGQMSNHEDNREHGIQRKLSEARSGVTSSAEESSPKVIHEKKLEPIKSSKDDVSSLSRYYLSKIDISPELLRPEVYNQCMSLLNIDPSETIDEETTRPIMSKDHLRAGAKPSKSSWISSVLPSMKDSVFQRAMDLYKKERTEAGGMPFLSKRALNIVSKSKQENAEQIHHAGEKAEGPVPTSDTEMVDAPNTNLDMENVEAVSSVAAKEKMVVALTPSHEVQNHNSPHSPRLKMAVTDDFQDNIGETEAASGGVKAEAISPEVVKSEDTNADGFAALNDASLHVASLSTDGDDMNKISEANGGHSVYPAEESLDFADAMNGPVLVRDGSPKDCEVVMSGLNESESVNLSRIHHSPESTH